MRFFNAIFLFVIRTEVERRSTTTSALLLPTPFVGNRHQLSAFRTPSTALQQQQNADSIFEEFGYLLQESDSVQLSQTSSRRVVLPLAGEPEQRQLQQVQYTSSVGGFPGAAPIAEDVDDDPYAVDEKMARIQQYQEAQSTTWNDKFKAMDFQDVVITLFIPGILSFVAGRWALTRASSRVTENADAILDSFAQSMVYCDGDVAEMQACLKSYQSKLLWMGANRRNKTMLKRYLEAYTKQRKVSPQAIASLSTVLKMFQLSEVKAATWMVELCEEMGTRQMASVGTLLFLGSRIFQSKEGKAALQPIQAQIMATYAEDERVGGEFLDSAQDAIAEAAYRNTILDAGPSKSVTPGWNVLGLTKERATEIFLEEQKDGFVTDREKMYGGQARQYDKKGRVLSKDGKIANPEEADDDEDDDDDMDIAGTSNVYECGQCGFTLFVAEGRESKFFGPGFKCPDCGASKSEFKGSDD